MEPEEVEVLGAPSLQERSMELRSLRLALNPKEQGRLLVSEVPQLVAEEKDFLVPDLALMWKDEMSQEAVDPREEVEVQTVQEACSRKVDSSSLSSSYSGSFSILHSCASECRTTLNQRIKPPRLTDEPNNLLIAGLLLSTYLSSSKTHGPGIVHHHKERDDDSQKVLDARAKVTERLLTRSIRFYTLLSKPRSDRIMGKNYKSQRQSSAGASRHPQIAAAPSPPSLAIATFSPWQHAHCEPRRPARLKSGFVLPSRNEAAHSPA